MLEAYARMLPRLRAEEHMDGASVVALGTGSMAKSDHAKTLARLKRIAGRQVAAERPSLDLLPGIGIEVVEGDG